jgi:hypothetical protein
LQPPNPGAWGWREHRIGTGEHARDEWVAQGRRLGWLEGENFYLEPEASYAEAQALAREQGEAIAVSAQTLRKRLREKGLLATTGQESDSARETLLVRKTFEGRRRSVLCMFSATLDGLSPHQKPDQLDHDTTLEGIGQVSDGNGQGENVEPDQQPDHENPQENNEMRNNGQVGQVLTSDKSLPRETEKTANNGGQVRGQVLGGQVFESASNDEGQLRINHLWDAPRVPHHCEQCGASDFDVTRDGEVLCIPCNEKEE